jgi:hypothetical protein
MNFGATGRILVDRQRLPLAAQIEHLQDVVEDLAQGQFGHRSTVPTREMRQDKFVELRIAQLHWNAVPRLAFGHLDPESIEILADSPHIDKKADLQRLSDNFTCRENLQPVEGMHDTATSSALNFISLFLAATLHIHVMRNASFGAIVID